MGVTIEDKVKEIKMILINDNNVSFSTAKKINECLKIILLLADKKEK